MHKLSPIAILLALGLAACSSTPTSEAPPTPVETRPAPSDTQTGPVTPSGTGSSGSLSGLGALKDPNNILSKRSVYFEYDRYEIQSAYQPLIEAHAKFLGAQPQMKVLIQGNADERGSSEYNLALGQKRAEAVKKALALLGARDAQLEAVSLGKEKPHALGHDEAAWAENRRSDILYSGEY
ncbi:MAG: peptidoglycan-associated lipoprotein Pal [Betaproteobacteria bacterium]|nr:peptidoglycan-associated lipoprotein Pal [Betaproteobacteria bacterium]